MWLSGRKRHPAKVLWRFVTGGSNPLVSAVCTQKVPFRFAGAVAVCF